MPWTTAIGSEGGAVAVEFVDEVIKAGRLACGTIQSRAAVSQTTCQSEVEVAGDLPLA